LRNVRTTLSDGRAMRPFAMRPFVCASLAIALTLAIPPLVLARRETASPVRPTSTRWAGYVDTSEGEAFTAVRATWVQPRIRCDRPNSSASFWIGLGGATARARGLEQVGTEADCSDDLTASYSAWYELIPVPARPIELPLTVAPGDTVRAELDVRETMITLTIQNLSTGNTNTTETTAFGMDLSSAEWIAEAPSFCLARCTSLPLADFRTVPFAGATASASGHTGPIGDPAWESQRVTLAAAPREPRAVTSSLSADGRSFSVRWRVPNRYVRHRR
jgi:Peptidase A4 family